MAGTKYYLKTEVHVPLILCLGPQEIASVSILSELDTYLLGKNDVTEV